MKLQLKKPLKPWFLINLLLLSANSLAVEYFPLNQVKLTESPFKQAQDRNLDYVMAMEPDRLLAPYLQEAGLKPKADNYGNWEDSGLNGHIGGHYITALSLAFAATGRTDVLDRLNYMLDELQRAQDKNGNGYLGGVPESDKLWKQIAKGDIRADLFSLNGYWVPWYNVHKTFAGLRDAYTYTGSEQARKMLIKWADWAAGLVDDLTDEQIQSMLNTEHGGMNEVFADVYAITGDKKHLQLAEKFTHRSILNPLQNGQDELTGLHANTQIPKVIGFERIADLGDRDDWHQAAEYFWRTVVNERSVAIGGNSAREHFHEKDNFEPMVTEVEGPETCNTYNMLRLTKFLYGRKQSMDFVDYYERALYNHILASQDPSTGGLVYFTPMRPNHYRVYSQTHEAMWCCVGSGIENHMKYGEFIYAYEGDELYVNLYIPSRLHWPEQALVLSQTSNFPDESSTKLTIEKPASVTLKLRYPSWAAQDSVTLLVNGKPQQTNANPGEYIALKRDWKKGDTIELKLPMRVHLEALPDGSDYFAVLYGPIALSAATSPFENEVLQFDADDSRMGHVADGQLCPIEKAPMLVAASPDFTDKIKRIDSDELRFKTSGLIEPQRYQDLELIPFFRLHRSRYMLYWPYSTPENYQVKLKATAAAETGRLQLEKITVDKVAPGEQQPESDHFFEGSESEAGVHNGRHWRHAYDWFGYRLNDPEGEAEVLRITYFGEDKDRSFTIEMNGVTLAKVELTGEHGSKFFTVDYPINADIRKRATNGTHELKFIADEGSVAGGIFGVRLLNQ